MNIPHGLSKSKIDSIGYDTVYVERPISDIIDFDWKNILTSPPKNTSYTTTEELIFIARETQNRTKKDIDLLSKVDTDLDTPFILLCNKYGINYPQHYINLFYDIVHPLLINTKSYWNRARPKQLADIYGIDIDVIVTDTHHTAAYPSGHTVYSSLVANILKDLYPKIPIKELDNIVLETAKARVLQGVHYPTDNKASLIFSKYVFNQLNNKLRKYYNDQI
jgi:hypothetical protein